MLVERVCLLPLKRDCMGKIAYPVKETERISFESNLETI